MLGGFAGHSMVMVSGVSSADPLAAHRQDVCQFSDDRAVAAQKLDFIHSCCGREVAEVRMFLDRIEAYSTSLPDAERDGPARRSAGTDRAPTRAARDRYLDFARDADQVAVRARMLDRGARNWAGSRARSSGRRRCA